MPWMTTPTVRLLTALMSLCAAERSAVAANIEHVDVTHDGVAVRASVVPAGATLALTGQVFPADDAGRATSKDAAEQTSLALDRLEKLLESVGASGRSLARVNLYAATPEAAAAARRVLDGRVKCAVATVVSALPRPGALVALDAVAVAPSEATAKGSADVRLLTSDRAVYVSGMSADGEMAEATRLTLEKLDDTLKHLGLARGDVVHVKSFLRGAEDVSASRAELVKFFGGADKVPPAAWVEWTMKSPIEIELVARAKEPGAAEKAGDTVTFFTPPGVKPAPLFSRVALVHAVGRTIFTSGVLTAPADPGDAAAETRRILSAFRALVAKAGGDFEHLAKATYYPATGATSAALNQVRPEFFNPRRPPAASKAPARGTGVERADLTLDFIAVTPPAKAETAAAKTVSLDEFDSMSDGNDVVVLDVRTPEEFRAGHVAGARNLNVRDPAFAEQAGALDKDKAYLVYCRSGRRSTAATERMRAMGFTKLFNFTGSMNEWNAAKKPVEKSEPK